MDDCQQTNIPTVDNTELECTEFVKDLCVNFPLSNPFLGLTSDSNLRDTVNGLVRLIQNNQRLIQQQRIEIDQLRVDVDTLLP